MKLSLESWKKPHDNKPHYLWYITILVSAGGANSREQNRTGVE